MKTERRHELRNNELAFWMTSYIETVKPYARPAVGVLGVGLLAFIAYIYLSNRSDASRSEGWQEYYEAVNSGNEDQLIDVAQRHASSDVGLWALRAVADGKLAMGSRMQFDDRNRANNLLAEAQRGYEDVLNKAAEPLLQRQALFGLARSYEALNDLLNAEKNFAALQEKWPSNVLGQQAGVALKRVRRQKNFYAWLFDQKPKPSTTLMGQRQIEFGEQPASPDDTDLDFLGEEEDLLFSEEEAVDPGSESGEGPGLNPEEANIDLEAGNTSPTTSP
ncbi:MAG: hypothetical protein CMJ81_17800 [Planctomycetaceae bacterium]|jgi:hypothetical protein|nr:hypothetical protein [Planctomycetaceae bacterium]MBP62531.1 hypothetical protein [Planctomycetaceae bacterium]